MAYLAKCPYCDTVRGAREKGAPCQNCGRAWPAEGNERRVNPPERRRASRRDRRGGSSDHIDVPSVAHREAAVVAVAKRIPLLVTGTAVSIGAFLEELNLLLPGPLTIVDCGSTLALNGGNGGTVILQNVDRCGIAAQRQLIEWLHMRPLETQLVSTSSRALFPLTATGAFLDTLYYRLNTVYVESAA